jgi:hypothetical protein
VDSSPFLALLEPKPAKYNFHNRHGDEVAKMGVDCGHRNDHKPVDPDVVADASSTRDERCKVINDKWIFSESM